MSENDLDFFNGRWRVANRNIADFVGRLLHSVTNVINRLFCRTFLFAARGQKDQRTAQDTQDHVFLLHMGIGKNLSSFADRLKGPSL